MRILCICTPSATTSAKITNDQALTVGNAPCYLSMPEMQSENTQVSQSISLTIVGLQMYVKVIAHECTQSHSFIIQFIISNCNRRYTMSRLP